MEKKLTVEEMSCVDCKVQKCNTCKGEYPKFCLTTNMDEEVKAEAMACYDEEETHRIMVAAAELEYDHYCEYTRVQEIVAFAKRIEAKKIGIATCVGLLDESNTLAKILRNHGFEVFGIACKAGVVDKVDVGIPERCMELGPHMCNPILQAKMLNKAKTDLNVVVGLCVGHDSLFYKYSDAICTTAVTKDRVLGHNPVAALYQADAYYKKKLSNIDR